MANLKLSMVLSVIDRATKPLKSLSRALGSSSKSFAATGAQGTAATKRLGGLDAVLGRVAAKAGSSRNGADRLGRELRGLSSETSAAAAGTARLAEWQDRLGRASGRAREQITRSGRALDRYLTRQAKRPRASQAGGFGRGVLGGIVGSGVFNLGRSALSLPGGFVQAAAQMETLETTLGTIEGSGDKAKESMRWISDFAATTPFQIGQVAESFVKLRAYGMEPTGGLLRSLGDTASAMGKDVMQAVEAIADAVTGENERLKEFGIKARAKGDTVTYEYGGGKTATADARDRADMQRTLLGIMDEQYSGAMKHQMKTYGGMVSNLGDQWFRFQLLVMHGGPFERLKGHLAGVLGKVNSMAASGELQELANRLSDGILGAMDKAKGLWGVFKGEIWPVLRGEIWPALKDIGAVVGSIAKGAHGVAEAVGGWGNVTRALAVLAGGRLLLGAGSAVIGGSARRVSAARKFYRKLQDPGQFTGAKRGLQAAAPFAAGAKGMAKSGWGKLSGWLLRIGKVVMPLAMVALKGLGTVLAAVAGVISGPVLAAVAAIGIAGVLIWKNWEPIKGFFGKLWEGVKTRFSAALEWIRAIDWAGLGKRLMTALAAGIRDTVTAPFNALKFALGKLRDLLPGSDARTGPLSRLTASGAAILPAMGAGVTRSGAGPLQRPLSQALGTAAAGLALAMPLPGQALQDRQTPSLASFAPPAIALPQRPGIAAAASPEGPPPAPQAVRTVHHHHSYRIEIRQQPGEDAGELAERLIRELERRQALAGREALGDAY